MARTKQDLKRGKETKCGDEPAPKRARRDIVPAPPPTSAYPPLDLPYLFHTTEDDGSPYILKWYPRSAASPDDAARAFLRAHEADRVADAIAWATNAYEGAVRPAEFDGMAREDVGEFTYVDVEKRELCVGLVIPYISC